MILDRILSRTGLSSLSKEGEEEEEEVDEEDDEAQEYDEERDRKRRRNPLATTDQYFARDARASCGPQFYS